MPTSTQVFADKDAWRAAGRPPGGVFPLLGRDKADARASGRWPDRYLDVQGYWIVLPSGAHWCPWMKSYSTDGQYLEDGWDIAGVIPTAMTVTPEIATASYTGTLTDGVFT